MNKLFDEIFPKYLKEDLYNYFFKEIPQSNFGPVFNSTIVCGGGRKREAVMDILAKQQLKAKEAIAVGDSITDIQMLEYIHKNGGTSISFNGNQHSLSPASIAYSGRSIEPLVQLIKHSSNPLKFVKKLDIKKMAKNESYFNIIQGLSRDEFGALLALQKK